MVGIEDEFVFYMFELDGVLFANLGSYVDYYVVKRVVLVVVDCDFEVTDGVVVAEVEAIECRHSNFKFVAFIFNSFCRCVCLQLVSEVVGRNCHSDNTHFAFF